MFFIELLVIAKAYENYLIYDKWRMDKIYSIYSYNRILHNKIT